MTVTSLNTADAPADPTAAPVRIDVWSDIACPWCYIGKRRLETALSELEARPGHPGAEVVYHSFELSPDTPADFDGDTAEYLARHKGMPLDQVRQMLGQVTQIAAAEGLDYHFDDVHQTKTLRAHELLHHAKAHGRQLELAERLFRTYFVEGRHVGQVDELVALAAEVGLDADEARAALESGRYADDVAQDIAQARQLGINGVPFFVVDGRYGVSGAQDASTFVGVVERVLAERTTTDAAV